MATFARISAVLGLGIVLPTLGGCEPTPPSENGVLLASIQQPAIYGDDDRLDVYAHPSLELQELATRASVAFMYPTRLNVDDPEQVIINAPIEGDAARLCPEERFFEQPAAAWCSGTLIDDDLVVTAGHCLGTTPAMTRDTCASLALVFNYYMQGPDELAPITRDDVFGCRQVVSWSFIDEDPEAPDYAVIQLDRPVPDERRPVALAAELPSVGDSLHLVGFGAQLPAKLDSGSVVINNSRYDNFFSADTDTFGGSSGSGLYNADLELVGVHSRGAPDWTDMGSCRVPAVYTSGAEEHGYAQVAVTGLCDAGWPSARLCQATPSCGDGVCSGQETYDSCDVDCPEQLCGNQVCEGEERGDCVSDCGRFLEVPTGWLCQPDFYGTRDGCDCECGLPDPDCDDGDQEVFGCAAGASCSSAGLCVDTGGSVIAANQPGELDRSGSSCQMSARAPSGSRGTSGVPLALGAAAWLIVLGRRRRRGLGR